MSRSPNQEMLTNIYWINFSELVLNQAREMAIIYDHLKRELIDNIILHVYIIFRYGSLKIEDDTIVKK
jgi:hypothetical protein